MVVADAPPADKSVTEKEAAPVPEPEAEAEKSAVTTTEEVEDKAAPSQRPTRGEGGRRERTDAHHPYVTPLGLQGWQSPTGLALGLPSSLKLPNAGEQPTGPRALSSRPSPEQSTTVDLLLRLSLVFSIYNSVCIHYFAIVK